MSANRVTQELEVISIICRGIDPRDGTFFETPRDLILDTARLAYLNALEALAGIKSTVDKRKPETQHLANHGKPWSDADDVTLKTMWEAGRSASHIAEALGRGDGAIFARLVFRGVYESRSIAQCENKKRTPSVCLVKAKDLGSYWAYVR